MTEPTEEKFAEWAGDQLGNIMDTLERKGKEYAEGGPALINFQVGASLMGMSQPSYLLALATKQWYAIIRHFQVGRSADERSEGVNERITDVIIYMLLLQFMISEVKK